MAVTQNTRRALEAVKALESLLKGLKREPATNPGVADLKSAISDVIDALEVYVQKSHRSGMLGAKSALSQEGRGRSSGQQKRQARIDRCD